jgi:endonuclease YncB( thermonuclease family)
MTKRVDLRLVGFCMLTLFGLYGVASLFNQDEASVQTGDDGVLAGCQLEYVYDGDTISLMCSKGKVSARLVGFDTPETKRAGCEAEKALGDRATLRLRELLQESGEGGMSMSYGGQDKYRRALVVLKVNGVDVATRLINEGLAVPYEGGKRIDWCKRLKQ